MFSVLTSFVHKNRYYNYNDQNNNYYHCYTHRNNDIESRNCRDILYKKVCKYLYISPINCNVISQRLLTLIIGGAIDTDHWWHEAPQHGSST